MQLPAVKLVRDTCLAVDGSLRMHTCAVLGDFSFYKRLFASIASWPRISGGYLVIGQERHRPLPWPRISAGSIDQCIHMNL